MGDVTTLTDLASRTFGGGVVFVNDEFFAAADHLIDPAPPVHSPHTFDHRGQVYDGWESRRRRQPGHDYVILRLGAPGVISGVDVDTSFFTGNFPPYASVDGCTVDGYPDAGQLKAARWTPLVSRSSLTGDSSNLFSVDNPRRFTHARLTIYPDGGVARLRVYGDVVPDPRLLPDVFDVAAARYGAKVTGCSNMFYGRPHRMLMPGPAASMGDGWETSRRRDDGNDWVTVRLAAPAVITHADLDTSHFKGNCPGTASLRGVDARTGSVDDPTDWFELLPATPLAPDTPHRFRIAEAAAVTHVRMDIYPDGGMARLRLHGRPDEAGAAWLANRFEQLSS